MKYFFIYIFEVYFIIYTTIIRKSPRLLYIKRY